MDDERYINLSRNFEVVESGGVRVPEYIGKRGGLKGILPLFAKNGRVPLSTGEVARKRLEVFEQGFSERQIQDYMSSNIIGFDAVIYDGDNSRIGFGLGTYSNGSYSPVGEALFELFESNDSDRLGNIDLNNARPGLRAMFQTFSSEEGLFWLDNPEIENNPHKFGAQAGGFLLRRSACVPKDFAIEDLAEKYSNRFLKDGFTTPRVKLSRGVGKGNLEVTLPVLLGDKDGFGIDSRVSILRNPSLMIIGRALGKRLVEEQKPSEVLRLNDPKYAEAVRDFDEAFEKLSGVVEPGLLRKIAKLRGYHDHEGQ